MTGRTAKASAGRTSKASGGGRTIKATAPAKPKIGKAGGSAKA